MQGFQVRSEGPLSHPLRGTAHVGGAKNSALKLMAAALLARGRTRITNVPDILDVHVMARLLEELGCTVVGRPPEGRRVAQRQRQRYGHDRRARRARHEAPYDLVRRLRASISVLGPLVARCGRARVALPGGDNIGSRGLDMHMTGPDRARRAGAHRARLRRRRGRRPADAARTCGSTSRASGRPRTC